MNSINLSELTLKNIRQWPFFIKISFITGIVFILMILGYWIMIKLHIDQLDALHVQETALKTDFETKQHKVANIQAYRNQLKLIRVRFNTVFKRLPTKNETPNLLEDISKTGVTSGLTFKLFAPQPEIQHGFYVELPIKIAVVGTYKQLAIFLSRVAEMSRMVTLHDFTMVSMSSKADKSAAKDKLIMNITAKIYRYRLQQ